MPQSAWMFTHALVMVSYDNDTFIRMLRDNLISPNEADSNGEPANIVDGLFAIARAIERLAEAAERVCVIKPISITHQSRKPNLRD